MTSFWCRGLGATVGVVPMVVAGALSGSWWWAGAVIGAMSAAGAVADRQLHHLQVLMTLALVVGLAVASAPWFVPVLVGGTIASIELGAAADRTTIIRPRVPGATTAAWSGVGAGALAAAVLVVGAVPMFAAAGTVLFAAAAAVVATRVIAR